MIQSVDDPIFSPELDQLGVYQPSRFLARTQRWLFSVGVPDFAKTQLVLVHGIDGTPRDFRTLIGRIDESRYSVWLFYYPSGLSLDQLGNALAHSVKRLVEGSGAPDVRLAIVAHSMGGLVGRRALNQICQAGRPPYLRMYASFDTPYGGVESAAGAGRSWSPLGSTSPRAARFWSASMRRRCRTTCPSTSSSAGAIAAQADPRPRATERSRSRVSSIHEPRPPRPR